MKSAYQIASWPKEDVRAHIAYMQKCAEKLTASGEWVDRQGLAGPDQAKLVRSNKDGR